MEPTLLAITGVLSTLGISHLQNSPLFLGSQRIWGEWAAWGLIALACRFSSRIAATPDHLVDDKEAQPTPRWTKPQFERPAAILALLFVASHCITVSTSQEMLQWSFPILTLFTFVQLCFNGRKSSDAPDRSREPSPVRGFDLASSVGRHLNQGSSAVVFVGVCLASSLLLLPPLTLLSQQIVVLGMTNACIMAMAYALVSIISRTSQSEGVVATPSIQAMDVLNPTAVRAFALMTLYLALLSVPFPPLRWLLLAISGLRVAQVLSVFVLCFQNSSVTATALFTASAAICDSFAAADHLSIGLYLVVAVAALAQASRGIHKTVINRCWLFVVLLLPITKLLTFGPGSESSSNVGDISSPSVHPIAGLVEAQNNRFAAMLFDQSKTLEEAVTEYKRRYDRLPPPGFDRWYAIAQEKGFLLIDEFDTIMQSLEPFWGVPASTLRARYRSIENAPDLIEFQVRKDKVDYTKDHYHASYLMEWMNYTTWGDILPEVNFMISTLDEPRVVAPYDTVDLAVKNAEAQKLDGGSRPNIGLLHKARGSTDPVKWISVGRQDAWEAMLSSCHIESPARSELVREGLNEQASPPFVSNATTSMDVCASPDLLHGHGFLASPESLTITHSLVPVFAQCKTSIFNDVLYPSPYYEMQMESGDYDESKDSQWDEKLDRVYWAGTATGGYSTAQNWMQMHRQRLTMLTSPNSDRSVTLLQKDGWGFWQTVQSTWAEIAHLFYLKITNIVQCSEEACEAMKQRFSSAEGVMESEPKEAALGSKYALDIDGNTFSGRYYRLLKSNVCVLKHTSFKEWHDGRLIPWVHYIPVSPGAEELGEMMRYLTQEEEGRKVGRAIAEQGRDWARKTLRKEDLEVVFMRVLMEYARVMRDGRERLGLS